MCPSLFSPKEVLGFKVVIPQFNIFPSAGILNPSLPLGPSSLVHENKPLHRVLPWWMFLPRQRSRHFESTLYPPDLLYMFFTRVRVCNLNFGLFLCFQSASLSSLPHDFAVWGHNVNFFYSPTLQIATHFHAFPIHLAPHSHFFSPSVDSPTFFPPPPSMKPSQPGYWLCSSLKGEAFKNQSRRILILLCELTCFFLKLFSSFSPFQPSPQFLHRRPTIISCSRRCVRSSLMKGSRLFSLLCSAPTLRWTLFLSLSPEYQSVSAPDRMLSTLLFARVQQIRSLFLFFFQDRLLHDPNYGVSPQETFSLPSMSSLLFL